MEIDELVQAVQTLNADDAFRARLTLDQWRTIAPYLARYEIRAGDLLIKQGDADRTMYFLAAGHAAGLRDRRSAGQQQASRSCAPAPSSASRGCSATRRAWPTSRR